MTSTSPELANGMRVRLRHALHAGGHFLPVGTTGEIVSLHRLHLRVSVLINDGQMVLRLPREALEVVA